MNVLFQWVCRSRLSKTFLLPSSQVSANRRAGGEASGTWFTRRRAESEALKSQMDPGVKPDVRLLWVSSISARYV